MAIHTAAQQKVIDYVKGRFLSFERDTYFDTITKTKGIARSALPSIISECNPDIPLHDVITTTKALGKDWVCHTYSGQTLFRVNQPPVIVEHGISFINSWQKPDYEPKAGNVRPFIKNLRLSLKEDAKVEFLLNFLAFRMQNPDAKGHQALYLYGAQGQGKGTLKDVMQGVFGKSAVKYAGKTDAANKVLNWSRLFLIVDEIHVTKGSDYYNELKALTVETELEDDIKYSNYDTHKTPAQLIMFSNYAPSFIEEGDRRFFVAEWDTGMCMSTPEHSEYFIKYRNWLDSEDAIPAIQDFLLNRDISDFNPFKAPPVTDEKEKALSIVANPLKALVLEMLEDNSQKLAFSEAIFESIKENNKGWQHLLAECGLQKHQKRLQISGSKVTLWHRTDYKIITKSGHAATVKANKGNKNEVPLKDVLLENYDLQRGTEDDEIL